jgi:hypothetical protein
LAIVDTINPVIELTEAAELPYYRGFFERLRQLGFAEGQNLEIKRYSGEGQSEPFGDMVSEVVNLKPDAIFVTSTPAALHVEGSDNDDTFGWLDGRSSSLWPSCEHGATR